MWSKFCFYILFQVFQAIVDIFCVTTTCSDCSLCFSYSQLPICHFMHCNFKICYCLYKICHCHCHYRVYYSHCFNGHCNFTNYVTINFPIIAVTYDSIAMCYDCKVDETKSHLSILSLVLCFMICIAYNFYFMK